MSSNCSSCKVQRKWGLKSWTWSRAPGKARREIEGRVACSECSGRRAIFTAMFQVCLRGLSTEAGMPKWSLAGEAWVLVPEGEGWISTSWSRWGSIPEGEQEQDCELFVTTRPQRQVWERWQDQRGRITARVASVHTCLKAPVLFSVADVLCCLGAFVTLN